MTRALQFGNIAVPWTVGWTGEESFHVGTCRFIRRPAICQVAAPGVGKPTFGKPHWERQRQCIAQCLCDLCGKPLKLATKVSLSHARPVAHGAEGLAIMQVEPLLHRACAAESMRLCPSLKRDIAAGTLMIRQVTSWRPQFSIMAPLFAQIGLVMALCFTAFQAIPVGFDFLFPLHTNGGSDGDRKWWLGTLLSLLGWGSLGLLLAVILSV